MNLRYSALIRNSVGLCGLCWARSISALQFLPDALCDLDVYTGFSLIARYPRVSHAPSACRKNHRLAAHLSHSSRGPIAGSGRLGPWLQARRAHRDRSPERRQRPTHEQELRNPSFMAALVSC